MLLVGGTEDAGTSVIGRITRAWESTPLADYKLRAASAVLRDEDTPSDVFLRLSAEAGGKATP
jgi:hypothetical protein